MSGQPGKNVVVAYKTEGGTFGTPVSGAGAESFRIQPGQGLVHSRPTIVDPEVRRDGMTPMVRLGAHAVAGAYPGTLSVGTFNTFLGALFRHAWVADSLLLTCTGAGAYVSLATTTANTLTLVGTGNFLTLGVKVGDVIRVGAMGAGVDDVNGIAKTVAANTITVLGTPWTNISADTNATLTLKKKLTNALGTIADPMVRSSYTIEQYYEDIDESEQFAGCRVSSLKLTFAPNAVVKAEFGIVGQTSAIIAAGASAPAFTTPTEYTSIGLIATDATICVAGTALATVTGGEITFDIACKPAEVVGSVLTPDVYEGQMTVKGQLTAIRTILTASHLARFLAETDNVELSILLVEPDAAVPIDYFHIFLPRIKYTGDSVSLGSEGPLVETIPFEAGVKATTTGYDSVMATISTSA